ncbi:MAG: copper chaperone PCu(A)C [Jannaschia sp.]
MRHLLAAAAMATFSTAVLTSPLWAEMTMLGDLHIEAPMLRATPPGAPVAGGFVTIENTGDTDDTLTAASVATDLSGMVQLHEMTMSDGVMSMSEVAGGIVLPAGERVTLMPGGLHIMLMGLERPLDAGASHPVTLIFKQAGEITLDFPVMSLAEIRAALEAGGADGDDPHTGHGN